MSDPFVIFWAVLIFSSIFWYGFLVFYVGIKAAREIRTLTHNFDVAAEKRAADAARPPQ